MQIATAEGSTNLGTVSEVMVQPFQPDDSALTQVYLQVDACGHPHPSVLPILNRSLLADYQLMRKFYEIGKI